jgi:hypothetical protein
MPKETRLRTLKLVNLARVITKESIEKFPDKVLLVIANPTKLLPLTGLSPVILSSVTTLSWHVIFNCVDGDK